MRCAVLIALHNGRRWIEVALRSVLAQSRPADEIIVADDGSTDGGAALVRRVCPEARVLQWAQQGGARTRNDLLAATDAPWVAFLDQDDCWHPEHLASLSTLLRDDAGLAVATGRWVHFSNDPVAWPAQRGQAESVDPWAHFPFGCRHLLPSAALIARNVLDRPLSFDPRFVGIGDEVVWLRLGLHHRFRRSETTTCAYRLHEASMVARQRRDGLAAMRLHADAMAFALSERERFYGKDPLRRRQMRLMHASVALLTAMDPRAHAPCAHEALDEFEQAVSGLFYDPAGFFDWWVRSHMRTDQGPRGQRARLWWLLRTYARWPRPGHGRRVFGTYVTQQPGLAALAARAWRRGQWRQARRIRRLLAKFA